MRFPAVPALLVLTALLGAPPVGAQAPESTPPPAAPAPAAEQPEAQPPVQPQPQVQPAAPDQPATPPAPPKEGFLPRLDIFFPEGDLDLKVSRLINGTFFEGQVKYNFVKGDINAFLRYRYYGYKRITQFTVFDSVEFEDIEEFSSDFDRVRGVLLLLQWPHSYSYRTYAVMELDRISSNKKDLSFEGEEEAFVREGTTNTFLRLGYQVGTPGDERSNAIVGESRARNRQLFTAFRDIGPAGAGFTGAVTYGFDAGIGDYSYLKAEFEALKRFDVTQRTFLVGRLRGGSFLYKEDADFGGRRPTAEVDRYTVPRSEYFRLDGRERLLGLDESRPGTEQLLTTWEYYFPWFLNSSRDFLRLEWQNWYWILYGGYGNTGFQREIYTDFDEYVPDVGLGFESSFKLRKYRFFLSGIMAQALKGNGGVEARISVKSYR